MPVWYPVGMTKRVKAQQYPQQNVSTLTADERRALALENFTPEQLARIERGIAIKQRPRPSMKKRVRNAKKKRDWEVMERDRKAREAREAGMPVSLDVARAEREARANAERVNAGATFASGRSSDYRRGGRAAVGKYS